jgi:hypothetical protein
MKTPFDGAIRIRRREIDEMRITISVQVTRLVEIEAEQTDADATMHRERAVAAEDVLLSSHAYIARMQAERERLARDQAAVDAHLTQLRAKALDAYGAFKAITSAAENYQDEAARAAARAEQGHLDDLSGANLTRERQDARRSTSQ